MADTRITDAEIAGYMGWRGPGAYTEASLRKIRGIVDHVLRAERAAAPSPSTAPGKYHVKDHVVREVVNRLRDTALEFHAHGSLRERLARELDPLLVASRPAEVDDEGLPPLPEKRGTIYWGNYWTDRDEEDPLGRPLADVFTAEQYRQGQRDAVAADRARRGDGWISVEDHMPPRYRRAYLVYTPDNKCVVTGHVSINDDGDEQWYHFASGRYIAERVSHWMELPAAPSHTTNKDAG